jgi:hypothetical protein
MSRIMNSLSRLKEATIHFLGDTIKKPDHKLAFFHIEKKRLGNKRLYKVSHTKEYLELFELGYTELNLDEYLKFRGKRKDGSGRTYKSGLAKRFYELWVYMKENEKYKQSGKDVKNATDWNFLRTADWIRLKDSNSSRKKKSLEELHEHFCSLGLEEKKPKDKKQQQTKKTEPRQVNQEVIESNLGELDKKIVWLKEEFRGTSIDFDVSILKGFVFGNKVRMDEMLQRLERFSKVWSVLKRGEYYRKKARFRNFAGALRDYLENGNWHFAKYEVREIKQEESGDPDWYENLRKKLESGKKVEEMIL